MELIFEETEVEKREQHRRRCLVVRTRVSWVACTASPGLPAPEGPWVTCPLRGLEWYLCPRSLPQLGHRECKTQERERGGTGGVAHSQRSPASSKVAQNKYQIYIIVAGYVNAVSK